MIFVRISWKISGKYNDKYEFFYGLHGKFNGMLLRNLARFLPDDSFAIRVPYPKNDVRSAQVCRNAHMYSTYKVDFFGEKHDPGSDANHTYSILPQIFGTRLYGSIDPIYSTKISRRGSTCSSTRKRLITLGLLLPLQILGRLVTWGRSFVFPCPRIGNRAHSRQPWTDSPASNIEIRVQLFEDLKNMRSSVGMMTFPTYGKIKHVPNHQQFFHFPRMKSGKEHRRAMSHLCSTITKAVRWFKHAASTCWKTSPRWGVYPTKKWWFQGDVMVICPAEPSWWKDRNP